MCRQDRPGGPSKPSTLRAPPGWREEETEVPKGWRDSPKLAESRKPQRWPGRTGLPVLGLTVNWLCSEQPPEGRATAPRLPGDPGLLPLRGIDPKEIIQEEEKKIKK